MHANPSLTLTQFCIARAHRQDPNPAFEACIREWKGEPPLPKPAIHAVPKPAAKPRAEVTVPPRVQVLIDSAASMYGVDCAELMSGVSRRGIWARQTLIVHLHDSLKMSYTQIARYFGYANHTTVLWHYRQGKKFHEQ